MVRFMIMHRLVGSTPGHSTWCNTFGQAVHTHLSLSLSSIIIILYVIKNGVYEFYSATCMNVIFNELRLQ